MSFGTHNSSPHNRALLQPNAPAALHSSAGLTTLLRYQRCRISAAAHFYARIQPLLLATTSGGYGSLRLSTIRPERD